MGLFLGFDRRNRLVRVQECGSGPFGSTDPSAILADCERALEVSPRILSQIRPPVFYDICRHASYTEDGLRVDGMDDVRQNLHEQNVANLKDALLATLREIPSLEVALLEMGADAEPRHHRQLEDLERRAAEIRTRIRESDPTNCKVPPTLLSLAGKRVPL